MRFRRLRLLHHSLYLCCLLAAQASAAEPAADVKAAFIYNFAKFVEWPATAFDNPADPLRLCHAGTRPLDDRLRLLGGREAQGHRIEVIELGASGHNPADCHILFLPAAELMANQHLLQELVDTPVLTVSDAENFEQHGGMIGLFVEDERLKFSVDLGTVQHAGLKMGARILQIASHVRRGP